MRVVLISVFSIGIVLGFQNCSRVSFETSSASLMAQQLEFLSSASLVIDDNAEFTKQKQVNLKLNSVRALEMKISNDENCSDGVWEPYTSGKVWTLARDNNRVNVHAMFKDIVGNVSACVGDEIVHDDIAPAIAFANSNNLITKEASLTLNWTSQDNLSGVDTIICKTPDNQTSPCTQSIVWTSSADGNKTIVVRAKDKAGNESADFRYSWIVDRQPPTVTINSRPSAVSGSAVATFAFSGQDAVSGIDKYLCRLDSSGSFSACVSPQVYNGLAAGAHKFEVRAVDKAGNESLVQSADWIVDLTAPELSFTKTPGPVSGSRQAEFAFVGQDEGQPISRFECKTDAGSFAACTSPVNLSGLTEGNHTFSVRGYDNAGNSSQPIQYNWMIDLSSPTVTITAGPSGVVNSATASFAWTSSDSGSGVKLVECRIDNGAYTICGLAGESFNNLAAGDHKLDVRVTDFAGNQGLTSRSWKVDLTPPTIQILSGPDLFTNSLSATFTFSASDANGISGYECRTDSGNYSLCTTPATLQSLAEGGHVFFVRAIDGAGNVSAPATRSWTIDRSPPLIRVLSAPVAIKTGEPAVIEYETIDLSSGIAQVLCGLGSSLIACSERQTVSLGNSLAPGSYVFKIEATDRVGNKMTESVNFQVTAKAVICDPFVVGGDAACNGGLVGEIFYLSDAQQTAFKALNNKTVDYFYANGIQVNALLALKNLFVSTRSFTAGFPSTSGDLIKDDTGATLYEYFAFRLETVLKLDPTIDQPGWYQFATLSDDGSMVLLKGQGSATYNETLVQSDGDHSTRMGCSSGAVYIDDTSRLPLMIKYYQGPRTEIALTLMWKRVAAMNSAPDAYCGISGNDAFFGPAPYTNFTTSRYADLVSRGWRVLAPSNLIAPPK